MGLVTLAEEDLDSSRMTGGCERRRPRVIPRRLRTGAGQEVSDLPSQSQPPALPQASSSLRMQWGAMRVIAMTPLSCWDSLREFCRQCRVSEDVLALPASDADLPATRARWGTWMRSRYSVPERKPVEARSPRDESSTKADRRSGKGPPAGKARNSLRTISPETKRVAGSPTGHHRRPATTPRMWIVLLISSPASKGRD
jgi:hypothetical protein